MKASLFPVIFLFTVLVSGSAAQSVAGPEELEDAWSHPVVVVVVPPPPQPPPPPPPPPAPIRSVMRQYSWPDSARGPAAVYVAAKDGTVRVALAIWVQDGVLHYVTREKSTEQLPLTAVDDAATRRLNTDHRALRWLPGNTNQ